MTSRLATGIIVSAMVRRVNGAGGLGVIRAKGDPQAGAVLVIAVDRDGCPKLWERGVGPDGTSTLIDSTPREASASTIEEYWQRRRRSDPDLWVIELDIPSAERFAAEFMLPH